MMIEVTRLNGKSFYLNADLIKTLEATPDTIVTLTTGEKLMIKESIDSVIERTVEYRKRLYTELPRIEKQQGG